jgi:hypothetical protein
MTVEDLGREFNVRSEHDHVGPLSETRIETLSAVVKGGGWGVEEEGVGKGIIRNRDAVVLGMVPIRLVGMCAFFLA